jgi:hypothetical protein
MVAPSGLVFAGGAGVRARDESTREASRDDRDSAHDDCGRRRNSIP